MKFALSLSLLNLLASTAFASLHSPKSNALAHRATRNKLRHADVPEAFAKRDQGTGLVRRDAFTNARATYYDTGLGACGIVNAPSDYIIALTTIQFGGGYPGPHCFEYVTIEYNGITAVAQITDECMGCPYAGIDLSQGLMEHFVGAGNALNVGVIEVTWWFNNAAPAPSSSAWTPPAVSTTPWSDPAPWTSSTPQWTPSSSDTPWTPPASSTPWSDPSPWTSDTPSSQQAWSSSSAWTPTSSSSYVAPAPSASSSSYVSSSSAPSSAASLSSSAQNSTGNGTAVTSNASTATIASANVSSPATSGTNASSESASVAATVPLSSSGSNLADVQSLIAQLAQGGAVVLAKY